MKFLRIPYSAALCSGVDPLASGMAGSPPRSRRYLRTGRASRPSAPAARRIGVSPATEMMFFFFRRTANNLISAAAAAQFTFRGGGVDAEPRSLHQELADLEAPLGRREVE